MANRQPSVRVPIVPEVEERGQPALDRRQPRRGSFDCPPSDPEMYPAANCQCRCKRAGTEVPWSQVTGSLSGKVRPMAEPGSTALLM